MRSSAEQLHHGRFNAGPQQTPELRLFVDLDICTAGECEKCVIQCSYFYHSENNGIASVAELATYYLVCRRCEAPHCVNACPRDALEQQRNNMLVRHGMRCVSCRSCSHACPYGTIYPEHVPQLIHICDFCLDRREEPGEPLCIRTCPYGALDLLRGDLELDANTFLVGDNLIVHSTHWNRDKA
ncbi:4Fe-4S dicluster domain-containing protein [Desulfosarcina variabilis]|uniref:4Fe-4S dicluster domain-containing protein n=1 Tax=Desulfosarcina variabilis TaxID=2300 RepID=UPI003AFA3C8C